jgi:hypothetical protein
MHTEPNVSTVAPRAHRLRRIAALLPLLAMAGCDGGAGPVDPGQTDVATLEVAAPAPTITVGTSMQMTATPRSGSGAPVAGVAVAWSSGNEAVAEVSAAGLVTAKGGGRARR